MDVVDFLTFSNKLFYASMAVITYIFEIEF